MSGGPMVPVRVVDVPGVTWTLAWAFAGSWMPRWVRAVVAGATAPAWLVVLPLTVPGMRHTAGRRVVARLVPRTRSWRLRAAGTGAGVIAAGLGLAVALGVLAGNVPVLAGWFAAGILVLLASTLLLLVSQLVRIAVEHRGRPARDTGREQRRWDRRRWKGAHWHLEGVASRLPRGGLLLVGEHVRAVVPAGASLRVEAASTRHAAVYGRYGLQPLPSMPLKLVTDP